MAVPGLDLKGRIDEGAKSSKEQAEKSRNEKLAKDQWAPERHPQVLAAMNLPKGSGYHQLNYTAHFIPIRDGIEEKKRGKTAANHITEVALSFGDLDPTLMGRLLLMTPNGQGRLNRKSTDFLYTTGPVSVYPIVALIPPSDQIKFARMVMTVCGVFHHKNGDPYFIMPPMTTENRERLVSFLDLPPEAFGQADKVERYKIISAYLYGDSVGDVCPYDETFISQLERIYCQFAHMLVAGETITPATANHQNYPKPNLLAVHKPDMQQSLLLCMEEYLRTICTGFDQAINLDAPRSMACAQYFLFAHGASSPETGMERCMTLEQPLLAPKSFDVTTFLFNGKSFDASSTESVVQQPKATPSRAEKAYYNRTIIREWPTCQEALAQVHDMLRTLGVYDSLERTTTRAFSDMYKEAAVRGAAAMDAVLGGNHFQGQVMQLSESADAASASRTLALPSTQQREQELRDQFLEGWSQRRSAIVAEGARKIAEVEAELFKSTQESARLAKRAEEARLAQLEERKAHVAMKVELHDMRAAVALEKEKLTEATKGNQAFMVFAQAVQNTSGAILGGPGASTALNKDLKSIYDALGPLVSKLEDTVSADVPASKQTQDVLVGAIPEFIVACHQLDKSVVKKLCIDEVAGQIRFYWIFKYAHDPDECYKTLLRAAKNNKKQVNKWLTECGITPKVRKNYKPKTQHEFGFVGRDATQRAAAAAEVAALAAAAGPPADAPAAGPVEGPEPAPAVTPAVAGKKRKHTSNAGEPRRSSARATSRKRGRSAKN